MKRVTITCPTPDAEIRYTLDNSEPTQSSNLYSAPFTLDDPVPGGADITVKTKAFKTGYTASRTISEVIEAPDMQKLATPTLSLSRSGTTVTGTIGNTVEGASYRYKIGSEITSETDGTLISGSTFSFTEENAVTVFVKGFLVNWYPSDSASDSVSEYVMPICAAPSISQSGNTVTFTCSTSGATIHYSGCGKSGTCSSGSSISISQSGTMSAYATATGYQQSSTTTRSCSYTPPTPTLATPQISVTWNTDKQFSVTITNYSSSNSYTLYLTESGGNTSVCWGTSSYQRTLKMTSDTARMSISDMSNNATIYVRATRSGYNSASSSSHYKAGTYKTFKSGSTAKFNITQYGISTTTYSGYLAITAMVSCSGGLSTDHASDYGAQILFTIDGSTPTVIGAYGTFTASSRQGYYVNTNVPINFIPAGATVKIRAYADGVQASSTYTAGTVD